MDAERGFIVLPPDGKYPGMTKLPLEGPRELVALGTGPEVEKVLLDAKEGRRHV